MDQDDTRLAETLVTPTRRLAHHLAAREAVDRLKLGTAAWRTPDIVTWSTLIERMHTRDRQAGRNTLRWLDDAGAGLAWERLLRNDPVATQVIATDGLARTAHRSWRTMHDYRITFDAFDGNDGPDVDAFRRWAGQFESRLEQGGWIDAARAPDRVQPQSAGRRLRFVGFDLLTPAQSAFVERLRAAGVDVVVDAPSPAQAGTVWVAAQDRGLEIEMAARWAARRLDHAIGQRIAIVVPGLARIRESVRRTLDRVLAPEATVSGGPAPESTAYELAAARSLSERPVVSAALEWLSAFTLQPDLIACSALLRNPFCRGAEQEACARAALDARLRRCEGAELGLARLAILAGRHGCPEAAALLEGGLRAVARWPRRHLPSAWARHFFELLQLVGWPGEDLDSTEHQARQRWQALLGEFGAQDDVVGPVGAARGLGLLRDLAEGALFEPQEIDAPLLVIDPETCAGMRFDALWVCGLDAGQWPQAAAPDPFLPRSWQSRRGVPGATAEISTERARRTLERLRGSAPEVILSVPAFEDDAPLLPSALLRDIAPIAAVELWPSPSLARATFDARPPIVATHDGVMPPLGTGERATGGSRLLELQSACPFRASAELRLGAAALEEPALGLDAATRGRLVHAVFAGFWTGTRSSTAMNALPAGERLARLRAAIAVELAPLRRDANGVLLRLLDIEAAWLERHGLELLHQDLGRPMFDVEDVEREHTVELGGLSLRLRVDRVDRLADGSLAVIDYKTGGNAGKKAWLDERPTLPQLPLYVEAYGAVNVSAVAFGKVRAGRTGFEGLARDPAALPGTSLPPTAYASWEVLLAAWHRRLEILAREFAHGDARLAPDPSRACRHCHLPALCRIGGARYSVDEEGVADE